LDDESIVSLSPELVLGEGGWNRNFARVLLIEEQDGQAVVLVDGNGDGAELELEYWSREGARGWACMSSSGYSGLGSLGRAETWATGTHVVALGKIQPGAGVRLSYAGRTYSRQANNVGIWGFLAPADPESPEKLPVVAS
jgi:hypothetical protein